MSSGAERGPVRAGAMPGAAVLLIVAGCAPERPNLLLITIDSLRWDHVGCYGYPLPTTPRLDRFATEGVRFEQAIAQAPWTTPSMVSFMTSRYPATHGVDGIRRKMPGDLTTLAEILGRNGYRTGAIVPFVTLWSYYGLNRGFDGYMEEYFDHDSLSSHVLVERARAWIGNHREGPFFFWVHFWDPHYNYRPSREVRGRFVPEGGPFGETVFDLQELKWRERPLDPPAVAYNLGRYDEEILFTDGHVGDLLDFLEESGLGADTLVVVTADHGEQFQEHGWLEHTNRVYDHLVRVPLLLRLPGRIPAGGRVPEQVELVDLLPTILDLLGITSDPDSFQGRSLARVATSARPEPGPPRPAFSETARLANLKAIRLEGWKYIHDFDSGRGELYRVEEDPGEVLDLAATHPERAEALRLRLEEWLGRVGRAAGVEETLDPGMEEKLRSLGYLR